MHWFSLVPGAGCLLLIMLAIQTTKSAGENQVSLAGVPDQVSRLVHHVCILVHILMWPMRPNEEQICKEMWTWVRKKTSPFYYGNSW